MLQSILEVLFLDDALKTLFKGCRLKDAALYAYPNIPTAFCAMNRNVFGKIPM